MPDRSSGQIDLEGELTCSICTELLFQPLTLLDCLHTFCGACLKEWFLSQASNATSIHPYTCPSCRASVRATKHNATVSTLLEMFQKAHPARGRTEEDKVDQRKIYKPGENVLPRLRRKGGGRGEEEDRRVLGDVMALSLEEAGISGGSSDERRERRRRRDHSAGATSPEQPGGQAETRQVGMYLHNQPDRHGRRRTSSRQSTSPVTPSRQIEHQSSLRSILSTSTLAPEEMEEEVMRQIAEDGLLEGIDLTNMDPAQEDEIVEMIAQAYRRKQEGRRRERRREQAGRTSPSRQAQLPVTASSRERSRTSSAGNTGRPVEGREREPESRTVQRRRAGSHSSHNSARVETSNLLASTSTRRGSQSVTDLSSAVPVPPADRPRRLSQTTRRTTEPVRPRSSEHNSHSPGVTSESASRSQQQPVSDTLHTSSTSRTRLSPRLNAATFPRDRHSPSSSVGSISTGPAPALLLPASVIPTPSRERPPPFMVPSISCKRCEKPHIEFDLHYNCSKCNSGEYNLCSRCYRQGKGCLHWYGFGWTAWAKYERAKPEGGYPATHEPPHILIGHRYKRHSTSPTSPAADDQSIPLEAGVFCDICQAFANDWYWKCDVCNDGEWGYCNPCVNRARHCTHPLSPVTYQEVSSPTTDAQHPHSSTSFPPAPTDAGPSTPSKTATSLVPVAKTLAPITNCDICKYSIDPSTSRFHCPQCKDGDYDICTSCYISLVKSGLISQENGHRGWRRCPQGHRMVVVGREDRDGGQKRIMVRDLVGGVALPEDEAHLTADVASTSISTSSPNQEATWTWRDDDGTVKNAPWSQQGHSGPAGRFPPDGGVGLRIHAHWSYYPADGVSDELMFPRGAEIREAGDINGDWYWGVYAGSKGLFPGNYGRVIGRT